MLAAEALRQTGPAKTKREADRNIIAAVDLTAKRLGNTRSVCRKYYIHPALIEAYLEGSVLDPLPERKGWSARKPGGPALRQHEKDVLKFLKDRLKPEARRIAASRYRKSSAAKPDSAGAEPEVAEVAIPSSDAPNGTEPTGS
jgi:DNA topoisomerase-1